MIEQPFTVSKQYSNRFAIGDRIVLIDLAPRWWRNPVRWLLHKLRRKAVQVVTAVDHLTGTLTTETRRKP